MPHARIDAGRPHAQQHVVVAAGHRLVDVAQAQDVGRAVRVWDDRLHRVLPIGSW
jgi:hypothetical protein